MNSNQKKWLSLAIAVALVALGSALTRNDHHTVQAPAAQVIPGASTRSGLEGNSVHVRKWGESGFTGFGTSRDPKAVGRPEAKNEASNAKK